METEVSKKVAPKLPGMAVAETKRIMQQFFDGKLLEYRGASLFALEGHQIFMAAALAREARQFSAGHELGHVLLWESNEAHEARRVGKAMVAIMLERAPFLRGKVHLDKWEAEFSSDYIGYQSVMQLRHTDEERIMAWAGVEFCFLTLDALEAFYRKKVGHGVSVETHPPAKARLGALRALSSQNPPAFFQMGKGIELIINEIVEKAVNA